jgi:hypothetical protein
MSSSLEQAQFHAFGYIISTYAKVEQGFKFLIAHLIDVPRPIAVMLCEPYTTANLRNVTKSLAAAYEPPSDVRQRITDMVGELKSFGKTPKRHQPQHVERRHTSKLHQTHTPRHPERKAGLSRR